MTWRIGPNLQLLGVTPIRSEQQTPINLPPPPEGPGGTVVASWPGTDTLPSVGVEGAIELPLYEGPQRAVSFIPGGAWGQGAQYTQWGGKGLLCLEEQFLNGRLGLRLLGGIAGSHTAPENGVAAAFDAIGAGSAFELRGDPWPNWSIVAGVGALHPVSGSLHPMEDMQPRVYLGFRRAMGNTAAAGADDTTKAAAAAATGPAPSEESTEVWDAIQEAQQLIVRIGTLSTPAWFDAATRQIAEQNPTMLSYGVRMRVITDGISWFQYPTRPLGEALPPLDEVRSTFAAQIETMRNEGSPRAAAEANRLEHQFRLLPATIARAWYTQVVAGNERILGGLTRRGAEIKQSIPELAQETLITMLNNYDADVAGLRGQVRNLQLLLSAGESPPSPMPMETENLLKCLAYGTASDCPPDFGDAISVPTLRAAIAAKSGRKGK